MTLTIGFASKHFELLQASATLVREPKNSESLSWAVDGAELVSGTIRPIPYDGLPGRLVIGLRDLRARRLADGREFDVQNYVIVVDLVNAEIGANAVTVLMNEHVVVVVRAIDAAGEPAAGVVASVSSASSRSISIGGVTDARGEFVFLAESGFYSIVVGAERQPSVEIIDSDTGERVVTVRI